VVVSSLVTGITGSQILKNADLLQIMNGMYDSHQMKYLVLLDSVLLALLSIPDDPYHFNSSTAISTSGTNFLAVSISVCLSM
jgi:hypothetical protein